MEVFRMRYHFLRQNWPTGRFQASLKRYGDDINLTDERMFAKPISLQDTMALIAANRTNRVIKKVIHIVGMSFPPVGF